MTTFPWDGHRIRALHDTNRDEGATQLRPTYRYMDDNIPLRWAQDWSIPLYRSPCSSSLHCCHIDSAHMGRIVRSNWCRVRTLCHDVCSLQFLLVEVGKWNVTWGWVFCFIFIHSFWRPTNGRAGNEITRSALIVYNGTPRARCVCAYLALLWVVRVHRLFLQEYARFYYVFIV